jgi:hypothetical protein
MRGSTEIDAHGRLVGRSAYALRILDRTRTCPQVIQKPGQT